jgi:alkylhydroperoxidase/carboxymuconolactone decarboxylase family protein YurZ
MTAARHFDQYAAIPGHDEIVAMAPAAVYSCLAGDSYTQVAIDRELTDMGATPEEVASTFAVMAAAMLVEACGGRTQARQLAARWTRKIAARSAQAVNGRNAGVA